MWWTTGYQKKVYARPPTRRAIIPLKGQTCSRHQPICADELWRDVGVFTTSGDRSVCSPGAESLVVIGEPSHDVKCLRTGGRDLI
jgi:hypothetical protein